jgi:hypothetical protein
MGITSYLVCCTNNGNTCGATNSSHVTNNVEAMNNHFFIGTSLSPLSERAPTILTNALQMHRLCP